MQRKVAAELLDDDLGSASEIAATLADLRRINNWFGGTRAMIRLLRRVACASRSRQLSVLEVGAGAGDVSLAAQKVLAREGIKLRITLLDRVSSHLPAGVTDSISGDALHLPFRDAAFDVVSSSLLAHHFTPDNVRLFAHEALRVARRAVLIDDLVRSRVHLALVYLGLPLFRSRLTWHDAPASVRQAYTVGEMRDLLSHLRAPSIEITRHYLYRMGILIWK
jgi:SAM-dependent methyltransferase